VDALQALGGFRPFVNRWDVRVNLLPENTRFTFGWGAREINGHTINNGSLTHVKNGAIIGMSEMAVPSL